MRIAATGFGRRQVIAAVSAVALSAALLPAGAQAQETAPPPADPASADEAPVQYPFACTAQDHGLELIVDNESGEGVEVFDEEGESIGYSRDCEAETRTWYYAVDEDGQRHVVRDHDEEAIGGDLADIEARMDDDAEVVTTTLTDGREVPYLIRHERGTINRFIYSVSMLTTVDEITEGQPDEPDHDHWNDRLLFQFQGGVGIGHSQGRYDDRGITGRPDRLSKGYAVIYSTATRTGDHYNLLVGGQTAEQVKDHFVQGHGEPDYTVALGSSGGGIQQYVYAQNHPELLDAGIPQHSYPDMTTQTIHVGDCALLDRWMDLEAQDTEFWADWDNRQLLQGLNSIEGYLGSTAEGLNQARGLLASEFGIERPMQTGSSECLEGWMGLAPLSMNPLFGSESNWDLLGDQADDIERTHWDDVREAYGTDPDTGFARVPWDNVGVQYGLGALTDGDISPEQFLDVNAQVGSWAEPEDMVEEAVPFEDPEVVIGRIAQERGMTFEEVAQGLASGDIPFTELFDPWSARNTALSEDGGETPAPRRHGDLEAIAGAHESGLVFEGELEREIPLIDVREYLEPVLDMHNTHQSFAARQRLVDAQGHHDGQLVWFIDTEDGDAPSADEVVHHAFDTIAEWLGNLDDEPEASVAEAAPADAVDACFDLDGSPIATGDGVWSGILDDGADGACTEEFETYTTSRIEAGAPITGDVYKCHTMPVDTSLNEGLYGDWSPSADERDRLAEIHPDGVCDYDLRGQADPRADVPEAVTVEPGSQALRVADAQPGAEIEVRQGGEVVDTATASGAGEVSIPVDDGEYVVAQRGDDGERGMLSAPARVTGLPFSDVDPDDVHTPAILRLADLGVLLGREDGTYRPSADLSRGQMASVVARAFDVEDVDEGPFPDVDPTGTHAGAINALAEAGIVEGRDDGTFRLHDGVTRGQLSSMLVRASGLEPASGDRFPDVAGSVHEGAIYALADAGVIEGREDGTFRPGAVVNRAQAATFVAGILDVLAD